MDKKATWELESISHAVLFPWENEQNSLVARNVKEARAELEHRAKERTQERNKARRVKYTGRLV